MAGNAETLLFAREVLGAEFESDAELARETGLSGLQTYARRGLPWPCGTHDGETPSLLLGLAGIGYFYLRLHDPKVPSVLLLRPERVLASLPVNVR